MSDLANIPNSREWRETGLFKKIETSADKNLDAILALLGAWMPQIVGVLASGGTSPSDYTLHDQNHSLRVADRMWCIIPIETKDEMSIFDLSLLLLSSHLHDIGMTPSQNKVTGHHDFLLSGESPDLAEEEKLAFRSWLLEKDVVVKANEPLKADQLINSRILLAEYCRKNHNDWSAEWIKQNSPNSTLGMGEYVNWLEDLILLCQSHHIDCRQLTAVEFDPRVMGSGKIVHLRYLAAVLRMADILDFDPERTPDVVFKHRDVSNQSIIHWYKDHQFFISYEDDHFIASARPASAAMFRAVENVLDDIDRELSGCQWLDRQTKFNSCPGLKKPINYLWNLVGPVHRDISPKRDSFVYINSTFRPDTQRILELLSGKNLYGGPMAAIREVIQNAFDAVKERMAHQRLNSVGEEVSFDRQGDSHFVVISGEKSEDRYFISCQDTGVGMNKALIEKSFLVAGQSHRQDLLRLEQKCSNAGFDLGRTGQFGIGVLSLFMIADQIQVFTRRASESMSGDLDGWIFTIDGISSWGELRKFPDAAMGCKIRLRLKSEFSNDAFIGEAHAYIKTIISNVPCNLVIKDFSGKKIGAYKAGWCDSKKDMLKSIIPPPTKKFDSDLPKKFLPKRISQEKNEHHGIQDALYLRMIKSSKIIQESDVLPGNLGKYRIAIVYFILNGELCLLYGDVLRRGSDLEIVSNLNRFLSNIERKKRVSWKGMVIRSNSGTSNDSIRMNSVIEVDFTSSNAGYISVDRESVNLSSQGIEALKYVDNRLMRLVENLCRDSSSLACINNKLVGFGRDLPDKWLFDIESKERGKKIWRDVLFPVVTSYSWTTLAVPSLVVFEGKQVDVVKDIKIGELGSYNKNIVWYSIFHTPDKICLIDAPWEVNFCPVWTKAESINDNSLFRYSEFPPDLKFIACCHFMADAGYPGMFIWNNNNPIFEYLNEDDFRWARALSDESKITTFGSLDVKSEKSKCISILVAIVSNLGRQDIVWESIVERNREKISKLLFSIGGEDYSIEKWRQNSWDSSLHAYGGESLRVLRLDKADDKPVIKARFQNVDARWMITRSGPAKIKP